MSFRDHARIALEITEGFAISTAGGNAPGNSIGTLLGLVGFLILCNPRAPVT